MLYYRITIETETETITRIVQGFYSLDALVTRVNDLLHEKGNEYTIEALQHATILIQEVHIVD